MNKKTIVPRILFLSVWLTLIAVLLSCSKDETPAQGNELFYAELDYWVCFPPGIIHNRYQREKFQSTLYEFEDKTRITIDPHIQQWTADPSGNTSARTLAGKIEAAAIERQPPDLVYTESEWLNDVLNGIDINDMETLISENAPLIYADFPDKFWKYRKTTLGPSGIPLNDLKYRENYGVWIIKKNLIHQAGKDVENYEDILELCLMKNTDQLFIFMQNENYRFFLAQLFGIKFLGDGELYFDYNDGLVHLVSNLHRHSDLIKKIFSLSPKIAGPDFQVIREHDWDIIHLPYGFGLLHLLEFQSVYLSELLDSTEYEVLDDYDFLKYTPFESFSHYFICNPADPAKTAAAAEKIIKNPQSDEILLLSPSETQSNVNNILKHKINFRLYEKRNISASQYSYTLLSLVNREYIPLITEWPDKVHKNYRQFGLQVKKFPLYGFDIDYEYRRILKEMNILQIYPDPKNNIYDKYLVSLTPEMILEILTSEESNRLIISPYRGVLEEVQYELSRRIMMYLD
jgi:hypothetical protein